MAFSNQFGFTEQPFSNTPDPKYFFPTKTHQEALTCLLNGIAGKKGFLVLTGDVGTGKTTICRTLLAKLRDHDTETALVLNPDLSETEILMAITRDFGLESVGVSKSRLMDGLYQHLERRARAGGNSLIIIDDAQNLPLRSLEQVRMISNFETDKEKLVQILLVGQPELTSKLLTQEFRQVRQRVATNAHLTPLSAQETREYILHRLAKAGAIPGTISFTEQAFLGIFKETRGYPRSINTLCDKTLAAALRRRQLVIDTDLLHEQVQALRLHPPLRDRLAAHRRILGLGAAAGAAAMVVIALLSSARAPVTAPLAAPPDPQLQVKLAAVEDNLATLEKRLELLRNSPDLADSLLRQSEALEKNLSSARAESQRLSVVLNQKEEELRALSQTPPDTPGSDEALLALKQREVELQSAVERFQEESRNRSEQIRHLEKALQTLKTRLTEAERLREELSRNLLERERLFATRSLVGGPPPELEKLRAENTQLRQSHKLLENIAQQTIQAQGQEIDSLKRENEQISRSVSGPTSGLAAPTDSVAVAR